MSVSLRYQLTGQIETFEEGWSWSCFFGSSFLGAPLFSRGLFVWGAVMVVFNMTLLVIGLVPTENAGTLENWMVVIGIGLSAFFGLRGNAMAINRRLGIGWEYADPRQALLRSAPAPRRGTVLDR